MIDPLKRIVTAMPLGELWDESGPVEAKRIRYLGKSDIVEILRQGACWFVIADCGFPLRWVAPKDAFAFWKREAKQHIAHEPLS